MSRVYEYQPSDDGLEDLRTGRWERNTRATLESKRGQQALRELEAALLALPFPKLYAETFCKVEAGEPPQVCVLGAYALYKGAAGEVPADFNPPPEPQRDVEIFDDAWDEWYDWQDDHPNIDEQARWSADRLGLTFTLAWNLIDRNDETYARLNPWQRHRDFLAWIRSQIKAEAAS